MSRAPAPVSRWFRRLVAVSLLGMLAMAAHWGWQQPFALKMRMAWHLARMPAPDALPMPVDGIGPAQVADTFGAPRGTHRTHAGVDIFAPAGTPVRASTDGLVLAIRDAGLGGRQVWLLGPGRERHYYAHLQDWAPTLAVGQVVAAGTRLGSVGNTGNARTTPPHLHYGIYGPDGARDPLPLLRATQ